MLGLVVACAEGQPRKLSKDGEHLTAAELPRSPAVHAEVYVPIYSNLAYSDGQAMVELSAQLTIRNTDEKHHLVLESVRYFDGSGQFLREELDGPQALGPMATTSFLVRKKDREGGSGANYLVRWRSTAEVSEPLMEAAMADLSSSYALAFTSRGVTTRLVKNGELE